MRVTKKLNLYSNFFQNKPFILYAVLFIIALIPRFLGLTFHSLWYDETSTALMVSQSTFSIMLKALKEIEGTPPLFYIIEKIFVDTTGVINEFTLRLMPMIFGTLSCVLMFYLIKKISTFRNALLTFILITFSNFFIYLSDEARCYSFFGFLVLLNLVSIVEWWNRPTQLKEAFILITLFFLTQVHYYSVFWVGALFLSGLLFLPDRKKHFKFIVLFITTTVFSYSLLTYFFLNQSQHEIGAIREGLTANWLYGIIFSPVKVMLNAYLYKIYSIKEISLKDLTGIIPVLLIIFISTISFFYRLLKNKSNALENFIFVSTIFAFVFHCMIGFAIPTIHPRYMAHFLIFLIPFIVIYTDKLRYLKSYIIIILLLLDLVANINFFSTQKAFIEPHKKIGELISQHMNNDTKSANSPPIFSDFLICHSLSFYFAHRGQPFFSLPDIDLDKQFPVYKMDVFGNTLLTNLYNNAFYKIVDTLSLRKILAQNQTGYFLLRQKRPQDMSNFLKVMSSQGLPSLSFLKTFRTNQGDISIYYWKWTETAISAASISSREAIR